MKLRLDRRDKEAIVKAMAMREQFMAPIPKTGSNLDGRVIADICRQWSDIIGFYLGHHK